MAATEDWVDERWADTNDPRENAFYQAAGQGDLAALKAALHPGLNINALHLDEPETAEGKTALHASVLHGHLHIIGFLLALGADMEELTTPHECCTALHLAAWMAAPSTVRLLVDCGADVNATFHAHEGDYGSVMLLPLNTVFPSGGYRPVERRHYDTIELLLGLGLDINAPASEYGQGNLIQRAVRCNNPELVQWLLDRGATLSPDLVRWAKVYNHDNRTLKYLVEDLGLDEQGGVST